MGKRTGVYKYIHALPRDAYGNRYRIGGKVLSQKFGLGTVIGFLSAYRAVSKYLNAPLDELY